MDTHTSNLSPILPIPSSPLVTLSQDSTRISSPPPLTRINAQSASQKDVHAPQAVRLGRFGPTRDIEARATDTDLEKEARIALYPYLFHLEKEQREVDLLRKIQGIDSAELKRLDEAWNALDKKIFTIHELLELMD